jgi:hypothetical protein
MNKWIPSLLVVSQGMLGAYKHRVSTKPKAEGGGPEITS